MPTEVGWQGDRLLLRSCLSICPFSKSPLNVPLLKEVTKNVHENQYFTLVSLKKNILLSIGFYQVENLKSESLFNNIKGALG